MTERTIEQLARAIYPDQAAPPPTQAPAVDLDGTEEDAPQDEPEDIEGRQQPEPTEQCFVHDTAGEILFEGEYVTEADIIAEHLAELEHAELSGLVLDFQDLSGMRARSAKLVASSLFGCSLGQADLRSVDARGCSFKDCDFRGVDARGMIVDSATDFTDALMDETTQYDEAEFAKTKGWRKVQR